MRLILPALLAVLGFFSQIHAQTPAHPAGILNFKSGTFDGWTVENPSSWTVAANPETFSNAGDPQRFVADSLTKGEANTGTLRSPVFVIASAIQSFNLSGWDGTAAGQNDADRNWVLLRSHPDGEILRRAHTPGGNKLTPTRWITNELIGRQVYLEVVDNIPQINPGGFAWIAFADYRQGLDVVLANPVPREDLFALPIDAEATMTTCRSIPFDAASPARRGETKRVITGQAETIPVGVKAETIYLAGMLNEGWDYGVAHWGEHPELRTERDNQVQLGSQIGEIELKYADGQSDRVPVVIGATAWFVAQWAYGPTHGVASRIQEPFASRQEYRDVLDQSLKIRENPTTANDNDRHAHYYLALKPRDKRIESIIVHDNTALRGRPLISAVTLAAPDATDKLKWLGPWDVEAEDLLANSGCGCHA